ncbi:MAG: hypothetical protein JWO32_374 [Bacteroidetes bacterium]|nr:hypothetical protein [Bacteroidota bacterium]
MIKLPFEVGGFLLIRINFIAGRRFLNSRIAIKIISFNNMTSTDAKEIADKFNEAKINASEKDLKCVKNEIKNTAKKGGYVLEYTFIPDVDFVIVNAVKNELVKLGFAVKINSEKNMGHECYLLEVDWSLDID